MPDERFFIACQFCRHLTKNLIIYFKNVESRKAKKETKDVKAASAATAKKKKNVITKSTEVKKETKNKSS